ncbi:MAG: hypothetical protein KDA80_07385 [Planctomycetaceae bacterium]|nr:hypothetical protein [Planctomycetaceae bacterium]
MLTGELRKRAACKEYEIHWETLQKILTHTAPPGYRRTKQRASMVENDTGVAEIDGSMLLKHQTRLLANLKAKGGSRTTAQH